MIMPKKVKKSKFNMTGQDPITEQMYGKGAVRLADCRMVIRDGGSEYIGDRDEPEDMDKWIKKVGLFGVAVNVPNMVNGDGAFQMWDCDIILIPRKKYRRGLGVNKGRADQVLCGGQIGNPDQWEELIFDKDD
jgi:hypothetical protein